MKKTKARNLLESERRRLVGVLETFPAGDLSRDLMESIEELTSVDEHLGDLGTETFEREKAESILHSTEAQLVDVDRAISKLEEGRYGICETCGERIPDERLEARPAARYCVQDQVKIEQGVLG